jgi:hypothetical protein
MQGRVYQRDDVPIVFKGHVLRVVQTKRRYSAGIAIMAAATPRNPFLIRSSFGFSDFNGSREDGKESVETLVSGSVVGRQVGPFLARLPVDEEHRRSRQ